MGSNCCQLKRDKEQELNTGIVANNRQGVSLETQFLEELTTFPITMEGVKVRVPLDKQCRTSVR